MDVPFDHGVELEDAESVGLGLLKAIQDKFLADVLSATGGTDGVAGVCDVPASPDIVGMEDVKSDNPDAFIHRHADIRLRRKNSAPVSRVNGSSWGKASPASTTSFQMAIMPSRSAS